MSKFFNNPTVEVARFVAASSVGRSLRANLQKLCGATSHKSRPSWSEIIDMISVLTDEILPTSGTSEIPDEQISWMKSMLTSYTNTWKNKNQYLASVLSGIVNQIEPFDANEIADHLRHLFKSGSSLAEKCLMEWGGPRARKLIEQEKVTKLRFASKRDSPTYAYCDKHEDGASTVTLMIGNSKNLIKSYLSLEFYFFHEVVSHALPEWDDLSGKLSEGYLYALEKNFFRANCHRLDNGFVLHPRIVDQDMEAHREKSGKRTSWFADLEGLYSWLDMNSERGQIPRLLLEISAANSARVPEKLLAMIEVVANQQDTELVKLLQGEDLAEIYKRLRSRMMPSEPSEPPKVTIEAGAA